MTKSKLTRGLITVGAVCVWLVLWEILAAVINLDFILPGFFTTAVELFAVLKEGSSYLYLALSFLRIASGFVLGVLCGIGLAFLTRYSRVARALLSPVMTVVRTTPVASFIMVLWLLIGSDAVPTVISAIMVAPIVWQNLDEGFLAIDKDLDEVCKIYSVSPKKRMKILVIPTRIKYLIPSILTSAGLSWKAGIAAEIISYTSNSIGKEIYLAKAYFESGKMFAWTIIVIFLSLLIENLIKLLKKHFLTEGE